MTEQQIAAVKQALEAMVYFADGYGDPVPALEKINAAITALRHILADQALDKMAENARELGLDYEPDYKALWKQMCERCDELDKKLAEWVGLTEDELYEIFDAADDGQSPCGVCGACGKCSREVAIAEAVEAKLKEKNT